MTLLFSFHGWEIFRVCVFVCVCVYVCIYIHIHIISWVFIERTDAEAETPILWPPHVKSWLIGKDPDAGRGWRQEEKGMTEDEMAGWYHRLNGQVWVNSGSWWWTGRPGVLRFMGSQRVGHDWVTELNWTELMYISHLLYPFICWWTFSLLPCIGCF